MIIFTIIKMEQSQDSVFNAALLGESGVGKTSILKRQTLDNFDFRNTSTIGAISRT
jgi:GTPase SAR1 family protein